jgi:hypothetical protein
VTSLPSLCLPHSSPCQAFQLDTDEKGVDFLRLAAKDSGAGAATATPKLKTTYLSGTMWIVRDGDKFVVFQRTDTRAVNDRRGLVADGQLKPAVRRAPGAQALHLNGHPPTFTCSVLVTAVVPSALI